MKIGLLSVKNKEKNIIVIKNLKNSAVAKIPIKVLYDLQDINIRSSLQKKLEENGFFERKEERTETLSLFIIVTDGCNLNCKYCFEKKKHNLKMSRTIADKILLYIAEQISTNQYTKMDITYSGGEPFLNSDVIKYLTEIIWKRYGLKYIISFSTITNGTIKDDDLFELFDRYGFELQITLDGYKETHDAIRTDDRENKTFELICNNINDILCHYKDVKIIIRINMTHKRLEDYSQLLDYIHRQWRQYYQNNGIAFYFSFLDVEITSEMFYSYYDKLRTILYLSMKEMEKGFSISREIIDGGKCLIRDRDGIVIDANGDLYECFSFLGYEQMKIGNIADKAYCVKRETTRYMCKNIECPFYQVCMGGCIYSNYLHHSELQPKCSKEYLIDANKILFACELYKKGIIEKWNVEEVLKHVSYDEFDIKEI